jgi:L-fuconate dehydratase
MVDANQVWDIEQAIEWMKQLAEFKPLWIEEPTSPDDILGHATISKVNLQNVDRSNTRQGEGCTP